MRTTKKTISDISECKTKLQAIALADSQHKPHETIKDLCLAYGFTTPQQIRDFVLFNMLRSISEKLDPGIENVYLNRIQENILRAI